MRLVGVTGNIACGKSTIVRGLIKCAEASGKSIFVIDADAIVHELQQPNSEAVRAIQKVFPSVVEIRRSCGTQEGSVESNTLILNREALRKVVFSDPVQRRKLNSIMSKRIGLAIMKKLIKAWWSLPTDQIVILDAPLLYETRVFDKIVSEVVVVSCSQEMQVRRLWRRNGMSEEESLNCIQSQMPTAVKKKWASYIIDTDDTDDRGERKSNEEKSSVSPSDGISEPILEKSRKCLRWIDANVSSWKFPCILVGVGGGIAVSVLGITMGIVFGVRHFVTGWSEMLTDSVRALFF